MLIVWGTRLCGKIDCIPGESHVATMFFHIYYVPLIPLYSVEVIEGQGGEENITQIPFSIRSLLVAWGRCFLLLSIVFGGLPVLFVPQNWKKGDFSGLIFIGSLLGIGAALYLALRWLASPARAGLSTERSTTRQLVRNRKSVIAVCSYCRTTMRVSENELNGNQARCKTCSEPVYAPTAEHETGDAFVPVTSRRTGLLTLLIGGAVLVPMMAAVGVWAFRSLEQPAANPSPPQRQVVHTQQQPQLPMAQAQQQPTQQKPPSVETASPQLSPEAEALIFEVPDLLSESKPSSPVGTPERTRISPAVAPQKASPTPEVTSSPKEATKPLLGQLDRPVADESGIPSASEIQERRRLRRSKSIRPSVRRQLEAPPHSAGGTMTETAPRSTHSSKPLTNNNPEAVLTPLAGGNGGGAFQHRPSGGSAVVGADWRAIKWDGTTTIGSIFPVGASALQKRSFHRVSAPPGYEVGGINVSAPKYVSSLQLVYMKLRDDGTLDPTDKKLSEWLGTEPQGEVTSISGNGKRVIGFHGRRAAVLDAIGLMLEP